jgi:hypothetical protein
MAEQSKTAEARQPRSIRLLSRCNSAPAPSPRVIWNPRLPGRRGRFVYAVVVALLLTGAFSTGLPANDAPQTPVSNTLEIDETGCGPLLVLVPAGVAFQLRIENATPEDRVIALPPDGMRLSIGGHSSEKVKLKLIAGQYRILCDSATEGITTTVILEALEGDVFAVPPDPPLATPEAEATPTGA